MKSGSEFDSIQIGDFNIENMSGKKSIQKRRNTMHMDEADNEDNSTKHITAAEEDILMSEILPKIDLIEKKSTDPSLNPQQLTANQTKVWMEILSSFNDKTKVCIFKGQQ